MADDHDGGAVGQQLVERVSDAEEDVGESWEEIDEEVRQWIDLLDNITMNKKVSTVDYSRTREGWL